ncbi:hypothetical protein HDU97_003199, partial [Phlyctochytrium planicorne]
MREPQRYTLSTIWQRIRKPNTFLGCLELAPGTSVLSFSAYLLATSLNICLFVYLNSSQTFVLTQILRVPTEILGDTSGTLTFADELLSLVAVWMWGIASDLLGRRIVYVSGFVIMSLALGFYTFAGNVYPQLLLLRLLFAVGGAAASSMLTAVLSDYATDKDRGKSSGLVGLVSGLGALLALFVFLRLPSNFDDPVRGLKTTYIMVAGIAFVFGLFLLLALRRDSGTAIRSPDQPPTATTTATQGEEETDQEDTASEASKSVGQNGATRTTPPHQNGGAAPPSGGAVAVSEQERAPGETIQSVLRLALDGVLAAKNVRVLLGYIGASLARGDTVIITIFMPLWVYKSYIEKGLCEAPSPDDPDIKDVCRQAYLRASALSGVTQTLALVAAPLFGWLADRFYGPFATIFAGTLGAFSYGLLFRLDPLKNSIWPVVCLVGVAEIGMVIGSLHLVTSNAHVPARIRGSVAGVSSACGAIGILVTSKLGGWLFDRWEKGAPFF